MTAVTPLSSGLAPRTPRRGSFLSFLVNRHGMDGMLLAVDTVCRYFLRNLHSVFGTSIGRANLCIVVRGALQLWPVRGRPSCFTELPNPFLPRVQECNRHLVSTLVLCPQLEISNSSRFFLVKVQETIGEGTLHLEPMRKMIL